MKKKEMRGFVCGFLTAVIMLGFSIPVAAGYSRQLNATFNDIKITLDGVQATPRDAVGNVVEPFIVDGTTYLPVRAVANLLGIGVDWDGATQTVKMTTGQGASVPAYRPTEQGESYRITYQKCELKKSSISGTTCYAIVEVENTGTTNLYLDDATFDFEDTAGNLIATYDSMISSDPDIIAPGEKGYFYSNGGILGNSINPHTDYVFKPNVRLEKAKNDIVRYDISNLSMVEGTYGPAKIIGRVTNNTSKDDSGVWIACVLYRADGTPIGAYGTNVWDLKAGETRSFDADSIYLSGLHINYSDIACYKVYASKTQYQF